MNQPASPVGVPERLRVLEAIGTGAFGKVFLAQDQHTGERLALKRLERADPASIYRFKQEFRALADVKHPNLVRLHELFSVDGGWSFSMDYVDGVRFDTWVRGLQHDRRPSSVDSTRSDDTDPGDPAEDDSDAEHQATPPSSIARRAGEPCDELRLRASLRQLVDGVLALHGAGILHRDLKPSNVLVDREGRVVILDFGLAATTSDTAPTSGDGRFGTPAYMSPEQVRGGTLTMASDWYAVGVMLYEALTGQLPFSGSTHDMLAARLNRDPRPPQALRAEAPLDLAELCMDLLHRNPTARPNGFQIAQRVGLDAKAADRPQHALGGTFVGRAPELAKLAEAFDATRTGRTVVAHVSGPSGYGKTTLIRRFLAGLALEREVVVLEGRCYERESMPFKALDDLVDALGRYLATLPAIEAAALLPRDSRALVRLFPSLGRLAVMTSLPGRAAAKDPQELRRRAFRALRDILARLSDARPVVLFIDDVHWGDADSAQLVRNLLAPPEVPPLLLVVGYRGESLESSELLRTLRTPVAADAAWQTVEMELGPLSRAEAKQLADTLMQGADERTPESRVADEAGGSPLLISELARFAVAHSEQRQAITLQDLVAHRVAGLPRSAQRLLQLIACSSRPVTDQVLSHAAALDASELRSHLERLRDERLIAMPLDSSSSSEILHDKLRGAVLDNLAEPEWRACHSALANALEQCGSDDLESIAHHHEAAGALVRARRWLEAAAERASASLAFYRAVQLYQRACAAGSAEETRDLRPKLAEALVNAGRGPEAARVFLELAAEAPDESASRKLRRRAAEQYIRAGYVQEALAEFGPLLHEAGLALPKTPTAALGSLLWNRTRLKLRGLAFKERAENQIPESELQRIDDCWTLATGLAGIDLVRSAHYHSQALLMALETGEPARIARTLSLHAVLKALEHADSLPIGEKHAALASRVADGLNDSHSRGWAKAAKTIVAFGRVELNQCVELADEAIALLRERSESTFREMGSLEVWFALHALFLSGRLKELAERAPACAREAEARGDRYTLSTVRAYALALHWTVQDRPDQGRWEADAAIASWPEDAFYHQHWARLRTLCLIDLYESCGQDALDRIRAFRPRMKRAMHLRIRTPRIEFNYLEGRGALECAAQADAPSHLGLTRRRIQELNAERHPLARVYALTLQAGLAALHERRSGAEAFGKAEAEFARLDMPLHRAACAWRRAQCLKDARGVTHAESQLSALGVVKSPAVFGHARAAGTSMRRTETIDDSELSSDGDGASGATPGVVVVFSKGEPLQAALPLTGDDLVLGRGNLPGIQLSDSRMSRSHVRIGFASGSWYVEDLGSRNGTWVDGKPITGRVEGANLRVVRTGDTLSVLTSNIRAFDGQYVDLGESWVLGPRMRQILEQIRRSAALGSLHITGETGTGKELAARSFHAFGPNATGPFVAVNCAAVPEGVAERLLFGAKKGAYSGANADAVGYAQEADGGTLFLDEVGELDLSVQAKLLRFLETREVLPLGASKPKRVDVRVCSATHRDLRRAVKDGSFREDLYYRVARPHVSLPPLRERIEDIPHLIDRKLREIDAKLMAHVSFVEACLLRPWPGNVRELVMEVQNASATLSGGDNLLRSQHLAETAGAPPPSSRAGMAEEEAPLREADLERDQVLAALQRSVGRVATAARELGVHRNQLRRFLEKHGIDPKAFTSS